MGKISMHEIHFSKIYIAKHGIKNLLKLTVKNTLS